MELVHRLNDVRFTPTSQHRRTGTSGRRRVSDAASISCLDGGPGQQLGKFLVADLGLRDQHAASNCFTRYVPTELNHHRASGPSGRCPTTTRFAPISLATPAISRPASPMPSRAVGEKPMALSRSTPSPGSFVDFSLFGDREGKSTLQGSRPGRNFHDGKQAYLSAAELRYPRPPAMPAVPRLNRHRREELSCTRNPPFVFGMTPASKSSTRSLECSYRHFARSQGLRRSANVASRLGCCVPREIRTRAEVDGGFCRGGDIVRAIAIGADRHQRPECSALAAKHRGRRS